jgi:hypothetical protein
MEAGILIKIKELRHLLVTHAENLRAIGKECHEINAICNAMVTAERLMTRPLNTEPEWCQLCGAEKHLVKSGNLWICCDCAAVEHANT